ncbi:MAG TPA: hypothetical protein VM513_13285 [Kofleriaceae bacterium]|nr:hypothetical protein [Kofleriaceae bacterium]
MRSLAALALLGLAACPADDAANPERLWLALDGSELQVRLIDYEPPPF